MSVVIYFTLNKFGFLFLNQMKHFYLISSPFYKTKDLELKGNTTFNVLLAFPSDNVLSFCFEQPFTIEDGHNFEITLCR
jgi:hypothetical protein